MACLVTLLQSDPAQDLSEVCDTDPVRIGPDTDLTDVAVLMTDYNLTTIPVVDAQCRILGLITVDDVLEATLPGDWRRREAAVPPDAYCGGATAPGYGPTRQRTTRIFIHRRFGVKSSASAADRASTRIVVALAATSMTFPRKRLVQNFTRRFRAYLLHIARLSPCPKHLVTPVRERSEWSRPVDVGAVLDGYDGDQAPLVINTVDHAVIAASGAMKSFEAEFQRLADAVRAGGQRAVQQLHDSGRHLLRQPGQRPA